jgi:hypothetical protein
VAPAGRAARKKTSTRSCRRCRACAGHTSTRGPRVAARCRSPHASRGRTRRETSRRARRRRRARRVRRWRRSPSQSNTSVVGSTARAANLSPPWDALLALPPTPFRASCPAYASDRRRVSQTPADSRVEGHASHFPRTLALIRATPKAGRIAEAERPIRPCANHRERLLAGLAPVAASTGSRRGRARVCRRHRVPRSRDR